MVSEDKSLVTYQSLGVTRGLTLHYDSLRANPTPIISLSTAAPNFLSLSNLPSGSAPLPLSLAATLYITNGNLSYQIDGRWGLPVLTNSRSDLQVQTALQANLTTFPTGVYPYKLSADYVFPGINQNSLTGTLSLSNSDKLITVNSINSPFGAGWGIQGTRANCHQ